MSDLPREGVGDVRGADAQGVLPTRWVRSSRAHRSSAMWHQAILRAEAPCGKSRGQSRSLERGSMAFGCYLQARRRLLPPAAL
jgi:hypothetical protein